MELREIVTNDKEEKKKLDIIIYSDGSCLQNPGPGGYGTIIQFLDENEEVKNTKMLSQGNPHTTNNEMELSGVIAGLQNLPEEDLCVKIITDSRYVVSGFEKCWVDKWKKSGWKRTVYNPMTSTWYYAPVKNEFLWKELDKLVSKYNVTFEWIKGHAGHIYNEECDRMARDTAKYYKEKFNK